MVRKIGQINLKPSSKKDPCGICGRKPLANPVLCRSCGNWIHGRCAQIINVTNTLAIDFAKGVTKIQNIRKTNCMKM